LLGSDHILLTDLKFLPPIPHTFRLFLSMLVFPKVLVLAPLSSLPTLKIFPLYNIQYHLFADDTQCYALCWFLIPDLVLRLQKCIENLAESYASLRLQLNPLKSEFIWFGTHVTLSKISSPYLELTVAGATVQSSSFVRDLGVILDSELKMKRHVNKMASTCYYHLRRLFQLRGCVRKNVMLHLVTSLILTRIDSCNSVLINLPVSTVAPLRRLVTVCS